MKNFDHFDSHALLFFIDTIVSHARLSQERGYNVDDIIGRSLHFGFGANVGIEFHNIQCRESASGENLFANVECFPDG